jgi:hypothetical protein
MKLSFACYVQLMLANSTIAVPLAVVAGYVMGCTAPVADPAPPREYVVDHTAAFEGATGSLELHCEPGDALLDSHTATTAGTNLYENVVVWPNGWRASARLADGRGKIQLTLTCISVAVAP